MLVREKKNYSIGVMQGRLTPPKGRGIQFFPFEEWEEEFEKAAGLGLDEIEFIFDLERYEENPLWTDAGVARINSLKRQFGIRVNHVCADFFMRQPFFRVDEKTRQENVKVLERLIFQAAKIGARSIEIPLLDNSSLKTEEEEELFARSLEGCIWPAAALNIFISLETDLPPDVFRKLMTRFNGWVVGAVYDSGNSSSLGYDPYEEVTVLWDYISNVHIKDRIFGGSTVPLGTGSANFAKLFMGLKKINYQGGFTLQAARGEEGSEVKIIQEQTVFLKKLISYYLI